MNARSEEDAALLGDILGMPWRNWGWGVLPRGLASQNGQACPPRAP